MLTHKGGDFMFCQQCGNEVPNDSQFCSRCGYQFNQSQPQTQQQQPIRPQYNAPQPQSQNNQNINRSSLVALFVVGIIWFIAYVAGANSGILWTFAIIELIILCGIVTKAQSQNQSQGSGNGGRITCKRCGSANINISINTYGSQSKGQEQFKKKSVARRAGTKMGRGMANMATMGMYGVFSKKPTNYVNVTKSKTTMKQQKIAICQDCGNSWIVF
jgi:hypothetical protein